MGKNISIKSGNLEIKTRDLIIPFRFYDPRMSPIPLSLWILHVDEIEKMTL